MSGIAKVGDSTKGTCDIGNICCPHNRNGTASNGSPNVFANGSFACRIGDTGNCNCPHGGTFENVGGSSTVFINGISAARNGDPTVCRVCGKSGAFVSGSGNVIVGG